MNGLLDLQRSFQAYLLGDAKSAPQSIANTRAASAETRLNVYADGIQLRFLEVLGEDYAGLRGLLGDLQFARLGREYARAHPSRHPSIRWFGRHLPAFLRSAEPWRNQPLVAEMAAFEWAKGELIDAPDAPVVGVEEIAAIPPDRWSEMQPRLVPAVRRLALEWNVPVLWNAIGRDQTLCPPEQSVPAVNWLLWRRRIDIRWRSIEPDEAWSLEVATGGGNFGALCAGLCERVGRDAAAFRAASFLKQWASDGLLTSI